MGRDLLYKPQVTIIPEEDKGDLKAKKDADAKAKAPAPIKKGPRDLGQVGKSVVMKAATSAETQRAHKHAYFNNDISGVRQANFNQGNLKALRGSEEATNLRKIVIPAAHGIDHPEPGVLQGAMDLMGGMEGFSQDLAGLLGRQGAWAKSQNTTVEMIKARMAQLEEMVEARKAALGRMANGVSDRPVTNITVLLAARAAGSGLEGIDDVAAAGTTLIRETASQAQGLHFRLAKMFGVKMQ